MWLCSTRETDTLPIHWFGDCSSADVGSVHSMPEPVAGFSFALVFAVVWYLNLYLHEYSKTSIVEGRFFKAFPGFALFSLNLWRLNYIEIPRPQALCTEKSQLVAYPPTLEMVFSHRRLNFLVLPSKASKCPGHEGHGKSWNGST